MPLTLGPLSPVCSPDHLSVDPLQGDSVIVVLTIVKICAIWAIYLTVLWHRLRATLYSRTSMSKLKVLLTERCSNITFFLPCGHNDILVEHLSKFWGRRTKTCQTSAQNRAKFCDIFLLSQNEAWRGLLKVWWLSYHLCVDCTNLQRRAKKWTCFAKQERGRARQKIHATQGPLRNPISVISIG